MKRNNGKKVLLITRKYPPRQGGMERYSYDLYNALNKRIEVKLVKNVRGNYYLPVFFLRVFFVILFSARKYDVVYFTDGVLAPFVFFVKMFSRARVFVTLHGLDLTWKNKFYQFIIGKSLHNVDEIICVSSYTKSLCVKKISASRVHLIQNAINFEKYDKESLLLSDWKRKYGICDGDFIMITVGRLVKRKGVEEFIAKQVPLIKNSNWKYFVIGSGIEKKNILKAIDGSANKGSIFLLGAIDEIDLKAFYKFSSLLVMPNLDANDGDVEGFGIVAIEAAYFGLPVLGTNTQGLKDSIVDGKTGYLCEFDDLAQLVNGFMQNGTTLKSAEEYVKNNFGWDSKALSYINLFD